MCIYSWYPLGLGILIGVRRGCGLTPHTPVKIPRLNTKDMI